MTVNYDKDIGLNKDWSNPSGQIVGDELIEQAYRSQEEANQKILLRLAKAEDEINSVKDLLSKLADSVSQITTE